MKNYTGLTRNPREQGERRDPRSKRRFERRAIKNDTRAQVEEFFEDQVLEAEALADMLDDYLGWEQEYEARLRDTRTFPDVLDRHRAANRWADQRPDEDAEFTQTHYFEDGRWIEDDEWTDYDRIDRLVEAQHEVATYEDDFGLLY